MTLEENIQQLRDSLTVTSAQTLRHETRLKEHQQWLEDNEAAFAKHRAAMVELDENITRIAAAQLVNEEGLADLKKAMSSFLDGLRLGGNGHQ